MTIDLGQLRSAGAAGAYGGGRPASRAGDRAAAAPARVSDADRVDLAIPAEPPVDVLDAIAAAAARARELAEANRELHFHADEQSGRIIVQVRDLVGNVIRTIPPSKALDVMAGLYGAEIE